MSTNSRELPIIQKTYDLILWYVPHLNKMPKAHKFGLGDRMIDGLYFALEQLITAKFTRSKLEILRQINIVFERLRYQTRLLKDFHVFNEKRYEYAVGLLVEIGSMLGNWVKQQEQCS